ncbi:hypothetical protein ATHL_03142 [Anaerolinea thermolimosa]|uniref:SAM-dependent methyltransferase n=1 Tax=Anaerolinea thermolimosa TaxID=229919 RepID=A0A7U9PUU6_9CHLR|nr:hypothetical protein [Anaerolinea thermolimosa]GAP08240.1 hypothetical protein ATHL_03142 [Anaerolinea thermolimosa]
MTTTKTRTTPNPLERLPLHPLLWGFYPLLALWLANLSQIPPFAVVRSALLTLALTGIVWLINLLLFRNWIKAGLGSSLFLLAFFTYGHFYNLVKMAPLLAPWLGRHRTLLAVVLAGLIGLYFLLWRTRKPLYALNQIASVIGLFLVLFVSLQILIFQLGRASSLQAQAQTRPEKPASNQEGGRDVYYILLDTYGRQDYLASIGIDNSEFVRQLEARGFVVDSCAQANYDLTAFSLAASLNMDYLDALQVPMHPELADEKSEELEGLLKYSRVRREFEQMGYQTVTFKAVYPWIDITDSDVYFDPEQDTSILQFHHGRPMLIDTLSFEVIQEGSPWVAYRQFCQHFLAPLALMAHRDVRLGQLLRVYIDGIPLDLASRLLPLHTRLNPGLAAHLHLHAGAQKRFAGESVTRRTMSRLALQGLVESLQSTVRALRWNPQGTAWADYYDSTNYTRQAFEAKEAAVAAWASRIQPGLTWDFGANTGVFSRAVARAGGLVVSWDIDPAAVEKNYRQVRQVKEKNILPLVIDLTNPSPALGWSHAERASLLERAPADLALALALIHHLAIANNVPLEDIALFFSRVCRWLIIEFVPKGDSQVQRLLNSREDIFPEYTPEGFERAFTRYFTLHEKHPLEGSARVLYLMEKK